MDGVEDAWPRGSDLQVGGKATGSEDVSDGSSKAFEEGDVEWGTITHDSNAAVHLAQPGHQGVPSVSAKVHTTVKCQIIPKDVKDRMAYALSWYVRISAVQKATMMRGTL